MRRVLFFVALLVALSNSVWAAKYQGKDVSAQKVGGLINMLDQDGQRRSLADFRDKVVVIYFGYTRCPDVCPTTLSTMASVMKLLGPSAKQTQLLWVTIDPERDTQLLLKNYVLAFNPDFIALRGTKEETDAMADAFKIGYQLLPYKGSILVDHSAFGYIIDRQGRTRLKIPYGMAPEQIASDIRAFLPKRPPNGN